jgi:hypothetical protein
MEEGAALVTQLNHESEKKHRMTGSRGVPAILAGAPGGRCRGIGE